MRNSLGGLIASLIGSVSIVALLNIQDPAFSWPYSPVWFILSGSSALLATLDNILNPELIIGYILTWIIIGLVISPFSKKGWNTLRTSLWAGFFLGMFSLVTLLLEHPEFWISSTRNLDLVYHFLTSIMVSLLALPSAIPVTMLKERIMKQAEDPIPDKIETSCECGAIFKSNPLICSECGRQLREPID
jgi:hypothetical protein